PPRSVHPGQGRGERQLSGRSWNLLQSCPALPGILNSAARRGTPGWVTVSSKGLLMRSFISTPILARQGCQGFRLSLLVVCMLAFHHVGRAQEPGKSESPSVEPGAVEVRFIDGGVLKLTLVEDAIEIETASGKKSVRPADLRKVEFAPRIALGDARL